MVYILLEAFEISVQSRVEGVCSEIYIQANVNLAIRKRKLKLKFYS